MFYCIGFDGLLGSDHIHAKLFRGSSELDLKNRTYISPCPVLQADTSIDIEKLTVSQETKFGISWGEHYDFRSQSWSEYGTSNNDAPIGELKVHLQTMFSPSLLHMK